MAGALNAALDVFCVGRGAFEYGLNLGVAGAAYATLVAQYAERVPLLPRALQSAHAPARVEAVAPAVQGGAAANNRHLRHAPAGEPVPHGRVHDDDHHRAVARDARHGRAPGGAADFWTLTYLVDPLFVAATSFVARDFGRRPRRVRRMSALLMGLSLVVGAAIAALSFFVAKFGAGAFTDDATVLASIRSVAPLMGAAQLVSALVLVTEGVLIGCGDLRYLLDVHCLNFVVLGGVLWWVGKTARGCRALWVAVFMNQALRMAQHAAHVWRGGGPDLFARNGDGEEDGER